MNVTRSFVTAMAVVLVSSLMTTVVVWAQDGRGRGGRGARGGGAFGSGFFGGGPGQVDLAQLQVLLLRNEDVHAELEMMPDQLEGLRKLAERQRGDRQQGRGDFDFRSASEQERRERFEQMQQQQAERAQETLEHLEELLLPAQLERLQQIAIQQAGEMALVNDDVAQQLGLSGEQVAAMKKDIEANSEKMRASVEPLLRERNFEAMREKAEAMRSQLTEKLLARLTSEQRAEFESLKGAPVELSQRGFGRRGGGAGFRGGRPDGGQRRGDGPRRGGRGGQRDRD